MQRTLTGILTPGQTLTSCNCAGVIAAAALKCMGGSLQARLYPRSEEERQRAIDAGYDVNALLFQDDLCKGEQVRQDWMMPDS